MRLILSVVENFQKDFYLIFCFKWVSIF